MIPQRGEMLFPSGTHAALDVLIEGAPQEPSDFCLELIGVVGLIECTRSSDFFCGRRFLSKRKLPQFNIGQ